MKNIKITLPKLWTLWMGLCTFLITSALIVLTGIFVFDPYFFKIDSCLDSGGGWNYEINRCFYSRDVDDCLGKGGEWDYKANECEGVHQNMTK